MVATSAGPKAAHWARLWGDSSADWSGSRWGGSTAVYSDAHSAVYSDVSTGGSWAAGLVYEMAVLTDDDSVFEMAARMVYR